MATIVERESSPHFPITEDEIAVKPISEEIEPEPLPQTWLTLETLLYGGVIVLGLALRLWSLGRFPLSGAEAQQSLTALQLYRGDVLEAGSYSPLLVTLDGLIFLLFHQTDATARLSTALLGSALILLPATLRRQLGPVACLLASAMLALSPTAIFLSRTLNSEIAVAAGALMIVSGFFNWAEDGRKRWLYLFAGGPAILLTAGPMAYSILIVFALVVLVKLNAFKALWARGLNHSAGARTTSPAPEKSDSSRRKPDDQPEGKGLNLNPDLQQAGIFFLVALIILSTAATVNLSGFGVTTNLFADWLGRFSLQAQPNAGFNAVFLLTIYEPFWVVAGLIGLTFAVLSGNLLRLTFAGWFVGALVLDLIMGGRPNGSIILTLTPLAFLVAFALADLFEGLQKWGSWSNEGIIMASGLVIAGFGFIGLSGWLDRSCAENDTFCQFAWLQAVAALALFVVIVAFFWYLNGPGVAIRGAAITGVVLGLIVTISIGWRLNYGPLMNLAYQPLAGIPVSTELVALTDTLSSESTVRAGDKSLLDITLIGPLHPALQWQLRDFRRLTQARAIVGSPTTTAIITPTPAGGEEGNFGLGEAYIGQDFAINAVWSPVGMQPRELLNWLVYRESSERPDSNKVVLWLRLDGR